MSRMMIAVLLSLTALGLSNCQGNRLQGSITLQKDPLTDHFDAYVPLALIQP
jgi:hypothetical protein